MNCGSCPFNDGYCYTSLPPKVKCTITNEYHYYGDECNCEEARTQKEAVMDYFDQKLSEPIMPVNYADVSVPNIVLTAEDTADFKGLLDPSLYADTLQGTTDVAVCVGCTPCLVCGDDVILNWLNGGPKICPTCQKAIKFVKEKFKKELDDYEV